LSRLFRGALFEDGFAGQTNFQKFTAMLALFGGGFDRFSTKWAWDICSGHFLSPGGILG